MINTANLCTNTFQNKYKRSGWMERLNGRAPHTPLLHSQQITWRCSSLFYCVFYNQSCEILRTVYVFMCFGICPCDLDFIHYSTGERSLMLASRAKPNYTRFYNGNILVGLDAFYKVQEGSAFMYIYVLTIYIKH